MLATLDSAHFHLLGAKTSQHDIEGESKLDPELGVGSKRRWYMRYCYSCHMYVRHDRLDEY
jgi:hypothetical protein